MPGPGHDFVIVVPVADRPQQLADCLASLAELCRRHPYGGEVAVLIVDDSAEAANVERHRAIAQAAPFTVHHLDAAAQRALVADLPADPHLAGIVGTADAAVFHHKGSSVTRNIAYLWLNRLPPGARPRLYWFLDSDQEFRVNVETAAGEDLPYAVDYLNALDRIFSATPARVLTGKVVGDPPVSPAVMAGTFLDDVLGFLAEMAALPPGAGCCFHGPARPADDAAYHDMADLFGFRPAAAAYRYRCHLAGEHDHRACLADFAARLGRFFDGEHPTRRSYYQPGDPGIKPARTIYTGNYVLTEAGLDWFVPFAALRLRMAGPTLGRILRAELGDAFVAANLPMLHRRTVAESGRSEFRPGVERTAGQVDLSGEFERQYFGDVMLFAMEALTGQGYPAVPPEPAALATLVAEVEAGMLGRYRAQQAETAARTERLAELFEQPGRWWQADAALAGARAAFRQFIANLRHNYAADAPAWRLIEARRGERLAAIAAAIAGYRDDRAAWHRALAERRR